MTLLARQLAHWRSRRETRANLARLLRYLGFLALLVSTYTVLFHVIMLYVEGERHSWITGFYWTLVVMTTLGFGDVTFASDIGRVFSLLVLGSGLVFLLVMLPFLLVQLLYVPWVEARERSRVPREVPRDTAGHVIIAEYDPIADGLAQRLDAEGVPCFTIEPDPARAADLMEQGMRVIAGESDSLLTYERLQTSRARLVFANGTDTENTNITLIAREVSADVPVAAVAEEADSIDILELSGANTVLPLKQQLGEYLANRVHTGRAAARVVGSIRDLQVAEFPARGTSFVASTIRDTHLRRRTGLSVVGLWQRGSLQPAYPHTVINDKSIVVVIGTASQLEDLKSLLPTASDSPGPVLLIGVGKVGQAAARALRRRGAVVHAIDRHRDMLAAVRDDVHAVFPGDAADRQLIERAGVTRAGSVLLTTSDDAMNSYLAVYCRRLNPAIHIVSRVTRNVEAIHRAGADFVLSDTTLGVEAVMSLLDGYEPVLLGEEVRLFPLAVPRSLAGRTLQESGIGSRTGMSVVAVQHDERFISPLTADTVLPGGGELLLLGSLEQRRSFGQAFQ